jgi:hypothetical protein
MTEQTDPDTGLPHISPEGLAHQKARTSAGNRFYADIKVPHFVIRLHQEAFPELAEQMKYNSDAVNIYAAFLVMLPLELKGKLTPNIRRSILKAFKL